MVLVVEYLPKQTQCSSSQQCDHTDEDTKPIWAYVFLSFVQLLCLVTKWTFYVVSLRLCWATCFYRGSKCHLPFTSRVCSLGLKQNKSCPLLCLSVVLMKVQIYLWPKCPLAVRVHSLVMYSRLRTESQLGEPRLSSFIPPHHSFSGYGRICGVADKWQHTQSNVWDVSLLRRSVSCHHIDMKWTHLVLGWFCSVKRLHKCWRKIRNLVACYSSFRIWFITKNTVICCLGGSLFFLLPCMEST